jgi:ankyrin repeat protein
MELTYDRDIFDAIEFGDLESVKMYWQKRIEIDYQEKGGNTMLMLAVYYGFIDIVEYLLLKGPNLNLRNNQGQTAADIAIEKGYTRILEMLKKFD